MHGYCLPGASAATSEVCWCLDCTRIWIRHEFDSCVCPNCSNISRIQKINIPTKDLDLFFESKNILNYKKWFITKDELTVLLI